MRYTDADRLAWDPFDGERDVDIRCRSVKIVTTRKPQPCLGWDGKETAHQMEPGTRARYERAIVDGEWGSYYICCACMDTWLADRGIEPTVLSGSPNLADAFAYAVHGGGNGNG